MFLVFCSVQMTQTLTHFIPFSSSNFFEFLLIFIKKNAQKRACQLGLVFFMSNYAGWDEKRHIRCKFACDAIFRSQTKETRTDIVTTKRPMKRVVNGRLPFSNVTFKKPFEKLFEKAVVQKNSRSKKATLKKVLFKITLYISSCVTLR
jgi:hypothetical protein